MKVSMTKKEYAAMMRLMEKAIPEIAQADADLNEEDLTSALSGVALPEETKTEEGGWGKAIIHAEDDDNNNAVEVDLNEVMVAEIFDTLYSPFLIKVIRAVATMYGLLKAAVEKFADDLGEFSSKWF